MTDATCRKCYRPADAGAYCNVCATDIMAKAFNPFFRGRRKKSGRPEQPRPPSASPQQRLFR